MAFTLNSYDPVLGGSLNNATGAELTLPVVAKGIVVSAAFAADERLAGVQTEIEDFRVVSPPVPTILQRNIIAPLVATTNTAVPYNMRSAPTLRMERAARSTARGTVISLVFPAILARVAVLIPTETGNMGIRAESTLDNDGVTNAMKKFVAKSYELDHTLTNGDTLKKITYSIAPDQPFLDAYNTKTIAELDVVEDDIVLVACSDTSPDAETISVDVLDAFDVDNLLNESHVSTLTNPDTSVEYKVGSLVRADHVRETGRLRYEFTGVAGAIQAVRLVPSIQVVQTAYPVPDTDQGYFELHVQINDRWEPMYPDWMLAFLSAKEGTGTLGPVDNFPREVVSYDQDGFPKIWNEIQLWTGDKDDLTNANIPYGTVNVFPTLASYEARHQTLIDQL